MNPEASMMKLISSMTLMPLKMRTISTTNQRFEKLMRLEQLGIFVDEAHHAFGNKTRNRHGT